MFLDPNRGWRRVSNRDHRTRVDWAMEVRQLLDEDYPYAHKVKLLCDNLNTHNIASLYEAFPAPEAHRLARKLEIYYTPRNGSWLNVAEIELSVLSQQCLARRISSAEELKVNWLLGSTIATLTQVKSFGILLLKTLVSNLNIFSCGMGF